MTPIPWRGGDSPNEGSKTTTRTRVYAAVKMEGEIRCTIREVEHLNEVGGPMGTSDFRVIAVGAATPNRDILHPNGRDSCSADNPCITCCHRARLWWDAWAIRMGQK